MVILFVFRIEAISDIKYSFMFKNSIRSKRAKSGLDYSKIVIVADSNYIGQTDAIVDKDEYNETRNNIEYIKNDAQEYVDDYVNYLSGNSTKYDKKNLNAFTNIQPCNIFIKN